MDAEQMHLPACYKIDSRLGLLQKSFVWRCCWSVIEPWMPQAERVTSLEEPVCENELPQFLGH